MTDEASSDVRLDLQIYGVWLTGAVTNHAANRQLMVGSAFASTTSVAGLAGSGHAAAPPTFTYRMRHGENDSTGTSPGANARNRSLSPEKQFAFSSRGGIFPTL